MPNPFVHIELNTTDTAKAKSFYGSLFDWKLEDVRMTDESAYTMIGVGEGTGGGMLKHPMPGQPSVWIPYIHVENVRVSTDKARSLGAQIVRDVTEIENMGWFSIVLDPAGAAFGLWQSKM